MIANPYQQYQRVQGETATGGQVVVLLYGGAIRFLCRAELHRAEGRLNEFRADLHRAQDILIELAGALDLTNGGEMAHNLFGLYRYMIDRVGEADYKRDQQAIPEVVRLLRDLKATWEEALSRLTSPLTARHASAKVA
ncbi:MAG: flagellar export chaperone FliS [Chloroflexota bacterium]|nr:flagellar export chaperone FliS [Dehalococcoidia bacterium]MDW8255335.1 flagellar export chaperone FliS [Chloroflexota bacterium]